MSATCVTPKTCSICGGTTGTAIGHNWENATCTKPKTCKDCGIKEGDPIEHKYLDSTHRCEMCYQEDPKMEEYRQYIARCDALIAEIKAEGPVYYGTYDDFVEEQQEILSAMKPIKRKLMALDGDDSNSAKAQKRVLTAELTKLEAELEDLYARKSRQSRIRACENEKEWAYEQLFG